MCHFLAVTYVRVKNFALTISSLMMTSEWPLVKLESFQLLHWSTHPDSKQSLATPSVELLLSNNLFYLVGAAEVVADDVEDKSFWS